MFDLLIRILFFIGYLGLVQRALNALQGVMAGCKDVTYVTEDARKQGEKFAKKLVLS